MLGRVITSLILCRREKGEKGSTDKFIYLGRNGGVEGARARSDPSSRSLPYCGGNGSLCKGLRVGVKPAMGGGGEALPLLEGVPWPPTATLVI